MAGLWALLAVSTCVLPAFAVDDTWTALGALPTRAGSPVFAVTIDPSDSRRLLAGTSGGAILRSVDGGVTWKTARSGLGRGVAALAFDPGRPGVALAGTRGAGVWLSADGGATWQAQAGTDARTVRAFAFAPGVALAGSDEGVLTSHAGGPWTAAGIGQVRVSALTANGAGLVVAGGDGTDGAEPLPLYVSPDGAATWQAVPAASTQSNVQAPGGSSMVSTLAATGGSLLMGTNVGLYASPDQGASWQQLTGGGILPIADFSAIATAPRHPERLYAASDGGATDQGGLWVSTDAGATFSSLAPPLPEVTALAVSDDDVPQVVVATFRPGDHAVALWRYRDAGGAPSGAVAKLPSGAAPAPPRQGGTASPPLWRTLLVRPETPFLAIGLAALAVVVAALVAHLRHGRAR